MAETEAGISMVPPPEDMAFSQMPVGKLANGGHSSKQSKKLEKETKKYQASDHKDYEPAHQKKVSNTIGGKGAQHCFERQCVSDGGSMDCHSVAVSCGKLQKMMRGGFGFPFGGSSGGSSSGSSSGSHPMLPMAKVLGRILKKLKAHGVKVHVVRIVPKPAEHQSPVSAKAAEQVRKAMAKDIKKVLEKAHSKEAEAAEKDEEKEEKERSAALAKSQKAAESEGEALKKEFPKNVKIKKSKHGFQVKINTSGKSGGAIMRKLAKAMMGGGF